MKGENMKREFIYKGISFYIGNYAPRKNEFEKGLKYQVFVDYSGYYGTGAKFATIKSAKEWIKRNIYRFY